MAERARLPGYVTLFDSGGLPPETLAAALDGKPYDLFTNAPLREAATRIAGKLPEGVRERLYKWAGGADALPPRRIDEIDADEIARWATGLYGDRTAPAVMIGSSNGAAMHLCAALGIPFLPQTVLAPIRRDLHPDQIREDFAWGRELAARVARNNPDLRVYQAHDPNQDRLMLHHMAYFRLKRRRLGRIMEDFLGRTLLEGGRIILLECDLRWMSTKVSEDHVFQVGGYGGLDPHDYFAGSDRIADFLARRGADIRQWDPPEANGSWPEAEWGFDPELRADVERFAGERGYQVERIVFDDPGDLSPLVADLHAWWYSRLGWPVDRLLATSFMLVQPHLALTTGSVPYWLPFNSVRSAERLRSYVGAREPFDEILLTLFSNSIEAVGIASLDAWREILGMARRDGRFVGNDVSRYPRDLGVFARHDRELARFERHRSPAGELSLADFDAFRRGADYPSVRFPSAERGEVAG